MRQIRNYQPNIVKVLDDDQKPKHTFYSIYSLAKWLICSGYSQCPNSSKGRMALAGSIKTAFTKSKKDIVNAYGFYLKLEGKAQSGDVVRRYAENTSQLEKYEIHHLFNPCRDSNCLSILLACWV